MRAPIAVPSGRRSDGEARSSDGAPAARRSRGRPRLGGDDDVRRRRSDPRAARACSTWPAASTRTCTSWPATKRWFTRMHGTDVQMPSIKRAWTFRERPLLHRARAANAAQVLVLGSVVADQAVRRGADPVGQRGHALEPAVRGRRRGDQRQLGRAAGAGRRSVRRRLHAVHDHPPAAEPVEAERHHRHRGVVRRRLAAVAATSPSCCARGTASATTRRTTSPSPRRRARR